MSGRGKGGAGIGKGGAKRHRKVLRNNIEGITKPAIRRLARRGGVKRLSGLIYEETRGVLKVFLENVIRDTLTYTEHAHRKTVAPTDVLNALRRQGRTMYGCGPLEPPSRPSRRPKARKAASERNDDQSSASSSSSSDTDISWPGKDPDNNDGGSLALHSDSDSEASQDNDSMQYLDSMQGNLDAYQQGILPELEDANPPPPFTAQADPYFGDLERLRAQLGDTVTFVQAWDRDEFRNNFDDWWKDTAHIRRRERGCPRLEKKSLRDALDQNSTYRVYNVFAKWENRENQGIAAFLILREVRPLFTVYTEIDYACAFDKVTGIMKGLIESLKKSGRTLRLDSIIVSGLTALKFWFRRGFRTGNPEVDNYIDQNIKELKFTQLRKKLQETPSFDFQAFSENDLLSMIFTP